MKKIIYPLLILPIIILSILGQCFTAYASTIEENKAFSEENALEYYSAEQFISAFGLTETDKYISIQGWFYFYNKYNNPSVIESIVYSDTLFWYSEEDNIKSSEISGSILTIELNSVKPVYYAEKMLNGTTHSGSVSISNSNSLGYANKVEIDFSDYTFEFYNNDVVSVSIGMVNTNNVFRTTDISGNYDGIPMEGLALDVSFTPTLSGEVDRLVEQNGVTAESNYFSMNLNNKGSVNAQYMFAIVPTGSAVNLSSTLGNWNLGIDYSTADGVFYYTCKEWVYAPTLVKGNAMIGKAVSEYSQNSIWHVISSQSSYSVSFNWSQLNLQKDVSYDAVVIAMPTEYTKPSRVFHIPSADYYINVTTAQEVYRSTFTVPNPVKYDPSCTDFGNTPNSGVTDVKNNSLQADGYIDDNGNPVIEKVDFGENLDNIYEYEAPTFSSDLTDLSLSDVSSILQQTTGFFDFLSVCFSWLPSWFWAIILFGLTALVIIGIVKAVT